MASIRARLTLWYTAVVVIVLIASAVAVSITQNRLALQRLDDELARSLRTLEGVMRTEFGEGLDLAGAAAEARAEVIVPDRILIIAGPDRRVVMAWGPPGAGASSASSALAAAVPGTLPPVDLISTTFGERGIPVRLLVSEERAGAHVYLAAVAAPLAPLDTQRRELYGALLAGVIVALIIAAAGGWIVGRESLRPLGEMARQAAAITAHTPNFRLQTAERDDELGMLASSFNGLLSRLATALQAQRQFMADASHEMRTPVSVVKTTAQVTLARQERGEFEYRESLLIVSEQATRLARMVDAMFLLSRAEASGVPLQIEPVYLDDIATETVRALQVIATQRDVTLRVEGATEVAFQGDDGLLRQLLANLLDNAIRFARRGGAVVVRLARHADSLRLSVIDDGPGVATVDRARIFERFVRADTTSPGAGLGLPIARWIAEAHGGELLLESSEQGRTCFTATFPPVRHA